MFWTSEHFLYLITGKSKNLVSFAHLFITLLGIWEQICGFHTSLIHEHLTRLEIAGQKPDCAQVRLILSSLGGFQFQGFTIHKHQSLFSLSASEVKVDEFKVLNYHSWQRPACLCCRWQEYLKTSPDIGGTFCFSQPVKHFFFIFCLP